MNPVRNRPARGSATGTLGRPVSNGVKKKVVDPSFAKGKKYHGVLKEIEGEGVCPFCPETFKWHTKPILQRHGNWLITENFNPYTNAAYHFIVVGKQHKEQLGEMTLSDWAEINWLLLWAIKKYKLKGGGVTMRFGATEYTGATVCHLHAHLIVPKRVRGKTKAVYFPIG